MLRPEIPTLPPPAYLLEEPDQPVVDQRVGDRHNDERPNAA